MRNKTLWGWMGAAALVATALTSPAGAAPTEAKSLVGQPILNFSLPSTQDRLIKYGTDYYGKHNLIITFFPAAFTPV